MSGEPPGNQTDRKEEVMETKPTRPVPMAAPIFDYLRRYKFKKVVLCNDTEIGLRAVIAKLGAPARMARYGAPLATSPHRWVPTI